MSPQEKLVASLRETMTEFLESAGFVKVDGEWVCADDLKADAR